MENPSAVSKFILFILIAIAVGSAAAIIMHLHG
jgi:hypothetical protein